MKCENCGKNEVTFVYESNVNGKITRRQLCSACAEKLGYTRGMEAASRRMMQGMQNFFDGGFFGGGLLGGFFDPEYALPGESEGRPFGENLFDDFFSEMPALGAPEAEQKPTEQESLVDGETQSRFARLRRINALKLELHKAVHQENYEHAAELRDQIRALEKESGEKESDK